MITMPVELYTDGSCLRNPGAGGYSYIIRYWNNVDGSDIPQSGEISNSQGYRLTTNNRMEMLAALEGLSNVIMMRSMDDNDDWKTPNMQVNIFSDSEYLCNPINQGWVYKWRDNNWMTSGYKGSEPKPVKNKDLGLGLLNILDKSKMNGVNVTFNHIKGHNGNEYNEKCDKLAVAASSGTNHIIDEEYEKSYALNRR